MAEEKIIDNGYTLIDILDELAEERKNFNPDHETDKRHLFANLKLADALRFYVKVNYGDAVLYSDDEKYYETSDDIITGD